MASIAKIATFLPSRRIAVADLPEFAELSAPDRTTMLGLGVEAVRDAGDRTATDLAVEAIRRLLSGDEELPPPSALILAGGRFPELLMASESTRAQRDAGLGGALAFSVTDLGCVSVSAATKVGSDMLAANPSWPGVVVAHGSRPPGPRRFRSPVTLNGDGGSAFYLARSGPLAIRDIAIETNGEYWDLFGVRYRDVPFAEWREICSDTRRYSFSLAVESKKRFARMNEDLLRRNGLSMSDVDHFVMQNISLGAYAFYEQAFDISFAAVCRRNVAELGHLGSSDIPLDLAAGLESGEFEPGDLVLVMNNAPVAAWSSMLVEVTG